MVQNRTNTAGELLPIASLGQVDQVQFNRAEEVAKSVISDETKIKRIALERC